MSISKNNINLAFADISTRDLKKSSPSDMNNEIEESLQTLEKKVTERDLGAKDGFGHQEVDEENKIKEMNDDQLRDVARFLTLGFEEVNLKERVQTLDYRKKKLFLNFYKVLQR